MKMKTSALSRCSAGRWSNESRWLASTESWLLASWHQSLMCHCCTVSRCSRLDACACSVL